MEISVVILTFNSEETIASTLAAAKMVSSDIHIIDSHSTDRTVPLCESRGATNIVARDFLNYSEQRNWGIQNLPLKHEWQLHLDADEVLSEDLIRYLNNLTPADVTEVDGFFIPRLTVFLGKEIRWGGMYPIWHMRLFRSGHGTCENRLYDQHFLLDGVGKKIKHPFVDDMRMPVSEWSRRHIRWAELEAQEILADRGIIARDSTVIPDRFGNPIEQKRSQKALYYRMPLLIRPVLFFLYRLFFRLGIIDGWRGFAFYALQTLWFRTLVDVFILEAKLKTSSNRLKN